ncbi:MAG: UDP-N-acetylmuramoyl-L-alanyl-D-glutamate--2,6-diaminopimelate ligase, partial [Elusimicrobia bacterium]|nr:UDP-N-acetylmuramoyl-L-alanyl-D-glutamate--2,6-diaminopimelate ligase [Elusimicrobiota bacterium]
MKIKDLIKAYQPLKLSVSEDMEVAGLSSDSKTVTSGDIFFALPGEKRHGIEFAKEALSRGAIAVASDRETDSYPLILFEDAYLGLSKWSAALSKRPADKMNITGVTGTNGKTTVSSLIYEIISTKSPAGIIGTSGYRYPGIRGDFDMTTPRPYELHPLLAEMFSAGVKDVVMEVSSHSLELKRVSEIPFSGAVFTNLTRDHLDFHKEMDIYYAAKLKLFSLMGENARRPIINTDDSYGKRICMD